ncbi:Type III restriction enzyme, res subunit family protein, expressed [Panicum miliaceum]|uniref:Type III restriction enzyme, res subunit family protein, expressed n=1 Tax=Panicum miliaceum TaxID=4540 RepID=A0A3L6TM48_PANMI|nr:Type III restriction enzyme, res subunit family protein, expressed [Panicum miliaceum]
MSEDDADPPPPPPPAQFPPPRRPHKQLQPRGYQVEVFAAALRGNTIAVLDTGSGKTIVAVMLAREHARRARAGDAPRRIVVFLAPTVHLVHQQFQVIREYTDLDAVECHGASGVGEWSARQWKEAIGTKEIVVMTPQILLDALRHAFLTMNVMSLLIFDECHRACGNHPYSRIMKEFYADSEWRPAIFGMTASPVATKGASTIEDCEAQVVQLELILDAKVYIVEDRNEIESFSPGATIVNKYYDPYLFDLDDLESKLQILYEEFDGLLVSLQESSPNKFEDTDSILEMSRKSLSRYHEKILYGLNTLGPVVTLEVVKIYNENINTVADSEDCHFSKASLNLQVNLLFTTDVTEEGIDVPNCSCVIRFDLPRTVCSYVQSRGRARRSSSSYVLMIERGNLVQQEHIFRIIRTEYYVKNFALHKPPNTPSYDLPLEEKYTYHVDSTGATITAGCCVNLIYKYCEKLPKDRYYMPKPSFDVALKDGSYQCTLTMPPNAAFRSIVGPPSSTCNLAKQLVSLEACKKLHQLGELNDHLVPLTEEPTNIDTAVTDGKCLSGPGTTKRKELHGTINVHGLSGSWIHENESVTLNTYRFDFVCDQEGENYAGFVLLIESALDDDVANLKIDLFLIPNKMVYTTVTPCGKIQLNKEQVVHETILLLLEFYKVYPWLTFPSFLQLRKGKVFQEFFFNGIFGRLFHGSRTSGLQREFIFRKGYEIQWSSDNMYLLLPLRHTSHIQRDLNIQWEAIASCSDAVEHLRNLYLEDGNLNHENLSPNKRNKGEEIIHLANRSLHFSSVKDSVVLSLHTGRIYSVLDLILDTTAEDSFDEMYNGKASPFASFVDYYHQKYGIVIQHPGQPLLLLKQSHNAHNLLFSKLKYLDNNAYLKNLISLMSDIGGYHNFKGYVRDSAFDTRRWVAPGQISLRPFPCTCGLETAFVPFCGRYISDDPSFVVGKPCDRGHRWMCSKTVSDCVEALVGAYYVGGGITAALWVMQWFGIDIRCDMNLVQKVKSNASHLCYLSKLKDIEELEAKLKYNFSVKSLLLEAITHPSLQELGVDYCYQRLEFLGDSVLDLLITRHLYASHTDVDPGESTDLRSALVSNENFAQAVVRNNIHNHLQHGSGILLEQITEYVRFNLECNGNENEFLQQATCKVPKVLGDIMESITGAIFIDVNFNVDMVWKIVEPLLSPMITPDKLALPPYRELLELCSHLGCFINSKCTSKGEELIIEMKVQLRDELLIAQGHDRNRKSANAKAAARILVDLKKRGLSLKQCLSKAKQLDTVSSELQSQLTSLETRRGYPDVDGRLSLEGLSSVGATVVLPIKMDKGGPRTALFRLCKILQWPIPKFEFVEQRFRTPIILDGVTTTNFNSFVSTITLHIPDVTVITLQGDRRTDKKSSQDSASLIMLEKLQELKVCICKMQQQSSMDHIDQLS